MDSRQERELEVLDREALLQTFLTESDERLSEMEEGLVTLETGPEDAEVIQTIFRSAHTLKGNAASLGFSRVSEFAHAMEDVLQRLRNRTLAVSGGIITLLLRAVDVLRQMVPDAVAGFDDVQPWQTELLKRLADPATGEEVSGPSPAERRKRPWGRRREDIRGWIDRTKTLRVDRERLDRVLNLTGEIAIIQERLRVLLEKRLGRPEEEVLETHHEAERLCMELQEQVMKIRMVPIAPVFRQYIRTVRDVAQSHGKAARLVVEDGGVEVDSAVIEQLRDPLTHMIRNALDHGIETPEKRKATGKDPCGRLILRALHEAGNILIELEDNGSGFNRQRIIEKALSKGMITDARNLSDEEVHRFVFEPGFSTMETVTDLSGRGVGMDVVRRNVEALRGSIAVDSREGVGSRIMIRLPLTMAIIDGFVVSVGRETYVIPLGAVLECLELSPEERRRSESRGVVNMRGEPLPYLRLRNLFALDGDIPPRESVVVVQHGRGKAGLVVDLLHGESQTVIRPLGKLFKGLPGVSGSTILGNGRVALILDVPSLLRGVVRDQGPMPVNA